MTHTMGTMVGFIIISMQLNENCDYVQLKRAENN